MLIIDNEYACLNQENVLNKAKQENDLEKKDKSKGKLYFGKLQCYLVENVMHMLNKVERKFRDDFFKRHNERLIILCSADGARHQLTAEVDSNVISFNLCLASKLLLDKDYKTMQSHNILTHMQVAANETDHIVTSAYTTFCKECNQFSVSSLDVKYQDLKIDFLELHDEKFIYALTKHSLYSRKHYLFLFCRCGREGTCSNNQCNITSNDDYMKLQLKSKKRVKHYVRNILSNL